MKEPKIVITIPARNSEKTLAKTYNEIPETFRKHVILSDNASRDNTVKIAKELGMKVVRNAEDKGYGGNVKSCFSAAMKEGADIVVLLHSDNQYDGTKIPELIKPITDKAADFVTGSRIRGDHAKGMPKYRFIGNRILTFLENLAMGTRITDLHSGMIAASREVLAKAPFMMNSNDYVFHSEFIFQVRALGFRLAEIGIPTRYFREVTSASCLKSFIYGFETLSSLLKFVLHTRRLWRFRQFIVKQENNQ